MTSGVVYCGAASLGGNRDRLAITGRSPSGTAESHLGLCLLCVSWDRRGHGRPARKSRGGNCRGGKREGGPKNCGRTQRATGLNMWSFSTSGLSLAIYGAVSRSLASPVANSN